MDRSSIFTNLHYRIIPIYYYHQVYLLNSWDFPVIVGIFLTLLHLEGSIIPYWRRPIPLNEEDLLFLRAGNLFFTGLAIEETFPLTLIFPHYCLTLGRLINSPQIRRPLFLPGWVKSGKKAYHKGWQTLQRALTKPPYSL